MWLRAGCDSYISWGAFHGHKNERTVTDEDGGGSSVFHKCWPLATEMIIDLFLHCGFISKLLSKSFPLFSIKVQTKIVVLTNTILSTTIKSTYRMCFQLAMSVYSERWNASVCFWGCKLMLKSSSRSTGLSMFLRPPSQIKNLVYGLDYNLHWSKYVHG